MKYSINIGSPLCIHSSSYTNSAIPYTNSTLEHQPSAEFTLG